MNKKYQKNIENQKAIEEKIEELRLRQEILKEEQEEMEQVEVLKEYRSIDISLDEFLEMMRNYKKERQNKKKMKELEEPQEEEENREKIMEDTNEGN
nr:conjugal transfer protein [uncultured Lachnoanaerobaculum sp.]